MNALIQPLEGIGGTGAESAIERREDIGRARLVVEECERGEYRAAIDAREKLFEVSVRISARDASPSYCFDACGVDGESTESGRNTASDVGWKLACPYDRPCVFDVPFDRSQRRT